VNVCPLSPSFQEVTTLVSSSSKISPTIVRVPSCNRIPIPKELGAEVGSHSSATSLFTTGHAQLPTHTHRPRTSKSRLDILLNSKSHKMQRTTLWTYPPLIAVEPIKGVVYKATQLNRPHPKLSVMSIDEVQKHEKRESAEMTTKLCRKRNKHSSVPDPRPPVRALTTATPAVVKTRADQDVSVHLPKKNPQVTLDNTKPGPIRRLKNAWKKMFTPKDSTKSATACRTDEPNAPDPSSNDILQSGFHCGLDGCNSCSSPIPSTPLPGDPIGRTLMVAPGVEVSQFRPRFVQNLTYPSSFLKTFLVSNQASRPLSPHSQVQPAFFRPQASTLMSSRTSMACTSSLRRRI
jgi:hypothetical protein